jgi:hypothetical protein
VSVPLLPEGSVSVYHGVIEGRVYYERAARVLSSDSYTATLAWWPGCPTRTVAEYLKALQTDRRAARERFLEALARRDWELADTPWQHTSVIEQVVSGQWFSVWRMHTPDGAEYAGSRMASPDPAVAPRVDQSARRSSQFCHASVSVDGSRSSK